MSKHECYNVAKIKLGRLKAILSYFCYVGLQDRHCLIVSLTKTAHIYQIKQCTNLGITILSGQSHQNPYKGINFGTSQYC